MFQQRRTPSPDTFKKLQEISKLLDELKLPYESLDSPIRKTLDSTTEAQDQIIIALEIWKKSSYPFNKPLLQILLQDPMNAANIAGCLQHILKIHTVRSAHGFHVKPNKLMMDQFSLFLEKRAYRAVSSSQELWNEFCQATASQQTWDAFCGPDAAPQSNFRG